MAMPMLARFMAGASLMPSPIMATLRCSASLAISSTLPSGSRLARQPMPSSVAMASAARGLSPVSMMLCSPSALSSCSAAAASGRIWSRSASRATGAEPA
ncbi:hypothetical protein D3C72_2124630 [compost metagenome]